MELILSAITYIVAGIFGYTLGWNKDSRQSLPSPVEQMEDDGNRLEKEIDKQFSDLVTEDAVKTPQVINCFICHGSGVAFTYDDEGGGAIPCSCDTGDRVIDRVRHGSSNLVLGKQLRKLSAQDAGAELDRIRRKFK